MPPNCCPLDIGIEFVVGKERIHLTDWIIEACIWIGRHIVLIHRVGKDQFAKYSLRSRGNTAGESHLNILRDIRRASSGGCIALGGRGCDGGCESGGG